MSLSGKLTVVAAVLVVSLYCLPTQTLATQCYVGTKGYICPPSAFPDATTCCPYEGGSEPGPYCCDYSDSNYEYSGKSSSGGLAGWKIGLIVGGSIIFILGLSYVCYNHRRRMVGEPRRATNAQTVPVGQRGGTSAGTGRGGVIPIARPVVARPSPSSVPPTYPAPAHAAACATVVSAPDCTGPQTQTMPTTLGEAPRYSEVI